MGGGCRKTQKFPNFNLRIFKTQGGGVSIFQKCPNYKLFSDRILKKKSKSLNLSIFNVNRSKITIVRFRSEGSSAANTVSNSNMSEFNPRRGVSIFKIIQKILEHFLTEFLIYAGKISLAQSNLKKNVKVFDII